MFLIDLFKLFSQGGERQKRETRKRERASGLKRVSEPSHIMYWRMIGEKRIMYEKANCIIFF